jgi:competence protein ComEA
MAASLHPPDGPSGRQVRPLPPIPLLARWREWLADRLPPAVRGGRLAMSPAAGAGLVLVALLAVLAAGWSVWHGRPQAVSVTSRPAAAVAPAAAATRPPSTDPSSPTAPVAGASPSGARSIVVDVAGRVRHPGVATLAAGSRVIDALGWAGGSIPGTDTSTIDLARPLADGEQVYVGPVGGGAGQAPVAGGSAGPGAAAGESATAAGPIDLNSATAPQLDTLPGVGPVLAGRIIDWRTAHGRFASVDELRQVQGLGGKKFETLRPLVRV